MTTKTSYLDHDTLRVISIIKGKLVNLTNLHVGGTNEFGEVDSPVIRANINGKETPYIPGTSLKGVFRSELERYYRTAGNHVCTPPNDVCDPTKADPETFQYCDVCGIFGGAGLAAHLKVNDAFPINENLYIDVRTGVGIHRTLGVAFSGNLYTFELLAPQQEFTFKLVIENIPIDEVLFTQNTSTDPRSQGIMYLLEQLLMGNMYVGGKTSAGLGQIQLKEPRITVKRYDKTNGMTITHGKLVLTENYQVKAQPIQT